MISPHAQALYDRLISKKGTPEHAAMPSAPVSGSMRVGSSREDHKHEGAAGGDLAPEKDTAPGREVSFDEETSDEPSQLQGLDQGQHDLHPGDQGIDRSVKAGPPRIAGKPDIHASSHDGHDSMSEGRPGGSFGKEHQSTINKDAVGHALIGLHHQSHPGTMGQKVNAKVSSFMKRK